MSREFRLGIDARPLCYPKSGIGRYTAAIVSRLAQKTSVKLYLYSHRPFQKDIFGNRAEDVVTRCGNIEGALLSSLFSQTIYPVWASRDSLDVFWSPRHHLPLMILRPSVVTIHDMVWRKAPTTMQKGAQLLESILMPLALKKAALIIAVSDSTARDISEKYLDYKSKMVSIPLAPFQRATRSRKSTDARAPFLFVGTIEPRKNLERMVAAYNIYAQQRKCPRSLVIAGSNGWGLTFADLESQCTHGKLLFKEAPSDQELEELYLECHCLIMASLYEGFGLPILEAFAAGKPVITSNVSSMPEVAGEAGLLVNPDSTREISSAMDRLSEDSLLWRNLADQAERRATQFSWETTTDKTLKAILSASEV